MVLCVLLWSKFLCFKYSFILGFLIKLCVRVNGVGWFVYLFNSFLNLVWKVGLFCDLLNFVFSCLSVGISSCGINILLNLLK